VLTQNNKQCDELHWLIT